ncbi:hypothetical protein N7G274_005293 [Stereocaulon virgatum]|uniref:Uncharacterized protein n=1 Tax=Stereocaulon virgatum TaxID=373712 RepID=A0ABR4AAG9_9LECA
MAPVLPSTDWVYQQVATSFSATTLLVTRKIQVLNSYTRTVCCAERFAPSANDISSQRICSKGAGTVDTGLREGLATGNNLPAGYKPIHGRRFQLRLVKRS